MGAEEARMSSSPKEITRALFGRVASKYRCSSDHTDLEDLDLLFTGLALDPGHRVLDVATGGDTSLRPSRRAAAGSGRRTSPPSCFGRRGS